MYVYRDKLKIANEELEKELLSLKEKYREIEEQLKGAQVQLYCQ